MQALSIVEQVDDILLIASMISDCYNPSLCVTLRYFALQYVYFLKGNTTFALYFSSVTFTSTSRTTTRIIIFY